MVFDQVATILGFASLIPIVWTWLDVVYGRQSRHSKWINEVRNQVGARPTVLIVDLLPGKDVRATVERYIQTNAELKGIPAERIFTVRRESWLKPDNSEALVKEIQDNAGEILRTGTDVLHLFYAGPVFAASVVGAEFANAGCRVLLYQNEQGNYLNFGPLRHPRF